MFFTPLYLSSSLKTGSMRNEQFLVPAAEYKEGELSLTKLFFQHPEATHTCFAEGDLMKGEGVFSGDLLIISKTETLRNQDTIAVSLNGTLFVQKIGSKRKLLIF